MDRVGPLHRAMAPGHCGSHAAIFKVFCRVRAARPLLNSKLAKLFRLAHAGWPGKEREEFSCKASIIEGFRQLGYITVAAVLWAGLTLLLKPDAASLMN